MPSTWGSRLVFCPDGCLLRAPGSGTPQSRGGLRSAESEYERGRDTAGVLEGLADGSMKAVVLVGADPIGDFPDNELAKEALSKADLVIAVDCVRSDSVEHAARGSHGRDPSRASRDHHQHRRQGDAGRAEAHAAVGVLA